MRMRKRADLHLRLVDFERQSYDLPGGLQAGNPDRVAYSQGNGPLRRRRLWFGALRQLLGRLLSRRHHTLRLDQHLPVRAGALRACAGARHRGKAR